MAGNTRIGQLLGESPEIRRLLGGSAASVDFTGVELVDGDPLIRGGNYTTPLPYPAASQSLLKLYASQTADTGADVITFFFIRGTGDAALFADTALVEGNTTTGTGPATLQAGQFHVGLLASAKLATAVGDAGAGMFGAHCKVYSASSSELNTGSKTAAIWLDNQHSASTNNGSEYTIYSTTGGTVPDAWARLETTSSGWSTLFSTGFGTGTGPVVTGATMATTQSNNPSAGLAVDINGTTYYIPLMAAA